MILLPILMGLGLLLAWTRPGWRKDLRNVSLLFLFCTAVGRPCVVPTGSMEPTIRPWDWVWLSHLTPASQLRRGMVVCFPGPDGDKMFCKRLIGLGGDRLEMRQGQLRINGQVFHEPWAEACTDSWGPVEVPEGRLFVMGDHRNNSFDSRYWGTIPRDFVCSQALGVAFPPQHWKRF